MSTNVRCARCGRVLTDPVSMAIGLGPLCRGDSGSSRSYRNLKTRRAQNWKQKVLRTIAVYGRDSLKLANSTWKRVSDQWLAEKKSPVSHEKMVELLTKTKSIIEKSDVTCEMWERIMKDGEGFFENF